MVNLLATDATADADDPATTSAGPMATFMMACAVLSLLLIVLTQKPWRAHPVI